LPERMMARACFHVRLDVGLEDPASDKLIPKSKLLCHAKLSDVIGL